MEENGGDKEVKYRYVGFRRGFWDEVMVCVGLESKIVS